ncbi:MAG: NAD(P)-binding domain-containing protein [Bacteroidia bacterium]|nr:NAD(P)-binding domain-containing protein [Bacteroidia bacterium]
MALIGAGSWGCALASVLIEKGHRIRWWVHREDIADSLLRVGRHPSVFPEHFFDSAHVEWAGVDVVEGMRQAEVVVLALPSRYVREVLDGVSLPSVPWVSCTKGLLPGSVMRPSQYLTERGLSSVGVLSGPSHAEEVILRKPTWVAVGSSSPEFQKVADSLFALPYFRLLPSTCPVSLEWVGVLKNIYAIGVGMVSLWGDNARAALAAVALREMREVLSALVPEEQPEFLSPAWAGDFLVTAFSGHSRNQRFGQLLSQGYPPSVALHKLGMVAEGYYAAQSLLSWERVMDFPLLQTIFSVIRGGEASGTLRESILDVLSKNIYI